MVLLRGGLGCFLALGCGLWLDGFLVCVGVALWSDLLRVVLIACNFRVLLWVFWTRDCAWVSCNALFWDFWVCGLPAPRFLGLGFACG